MLDVNKLQPCNAFFDLDLAGLNQIYYYPNHPIEFEYIDRATGELPEVTFTLFDEAGFEVEPYIWLGRNSEHGFPEGRFRWGYTFKEDVDSGWRDFQVSSMSPVFRDNTFTLTLRGTPLGASANSGNAMQGTLEEIIDKFKKDHKVEVEIDPPFNKSQMEAVGVNDKDSTAPTQMKHMKWASSESDLRFLNRILKNAISQDNKTGYRAILRQNKEKTQKTLLITLPQEGEADYTYEVQHKDSVVVEWNPNIQFLNVIEASHDGQYNTKEQATGDSKKIVLQNQLVKDYMVTFGKDVKPLTKSVPAKEDASELSQTAGSIEDQVKSSASRVRSLSMASHINAALCEHIISMMEQNPCELTILGDPSVESGKICEVIFRYPVNYFNRFIANKPHYTSGKYFINEVRHRISGGVYLTILSLQRIAFDFPYQEEIER